jgi:hypothetical protein
MGTTNINKKLAKVGDVYCMRNGFVSANWCASQIIKIEKDYFILIELEWYSENLPNSNDLKNLRPLQKYRNSNNGEVAISIVSYSDILIPPERFILIGTKETPNILIKKRRYQFTFEYNKFKFNTEGIESEWPTPNTQMYYETEWRKLPEDERIKFKKSYANNTKIKIDGLAEQQCSTRDRYLEVKDNGISDWHILDTLGCLTAMIVNGRQTGLIEYIKNRQLITELIWNNCIDKFVDISETCIKELTINTKAEITINLGVKNNHLNLEEINIEQLKVVHSSHGKDLAISIRNSKTGKIPNFKLHDLTEFQLYGKFKTFDVKLIAEAYPNLESLAIAGNLAIGENIAYLAKLSKLRYLQLDEVFGYQAVDFPSRLDLKNLEQLIIRVYPKEATDKIHREFSNLHELELVGGKTADWVADNIDNPFRAWEERHFSEKDLKVAKNAYKSILKASSSLVKFDEKAIVKILKEFVMTMNKISTKIQTTERDEVSNIFDDVLLKLGIDPKSRKYQNYFDDWRDF